MQKAIEEAKRFVCTTTDRIVKDAKEFIQNVDWKKVAIGVAATAAITLAVVATGGAAAPVLIGAAVGAGISTGTTVVSGVIQGKSPAEIAKDASGAFMWGAIGGAVGGGTTQLLGKVGTKVIGKVGKKVIEDGVDMALDLAQTASENGGLTGKDILFSATTTLSGGLLSSVKTPSTVRNQLIDGATDTNNTKYLDDALHGSKKNPVTVEYKTQGDADEFARQLKEQQDGLNNMTAGEIKENIEKYRSNGRSSDSSKAIREYRKNNNVPTNNDVTHRTDMSIGGNPTDISGHGDRGINRSIGSQNKNKQDLIYDTVSKLDPNEHPNFNFTIK